MIPIEIGLRVVRGPDWRWLDEDGGEGGLGTLISVKPSGHQSNIVSVLWDIGHKSSCYRVGADNAYDLHVYDSGPIGVKHDLNCGTCLDKRSGIVGSRYSCVECNNLDLCASCYHSDKHDLSHAFYRVDSPQAPPVVLTPRRASMKIHVRGFTIGTKVMRGLNWEWDNQDGGLGKTGRIINIEDGKVGKSYRSIAKVLWSVGKENIYRIGNNGKVDLKCLGGGASHAVYKCHLPVLGQEISTGHVLRRGDRVKLTSDAKVLQHVQQSTKGGWTPQLLNFLGHVGIVHRITEQKLVRVRFDNCDNKWTFDPRVLSKVDPFMAGDFVYFIPDEQNARQNLKGHGEWIEKMATDLGDIGIVIRVYGDKDVRVAFRKNTWTLSPKCLELVQSNPQTRPSEAYSLETTYREILLPFLETRTAGSDNSSAGSTPTHSTIRNSSTYSSPIVHPSINVASICSPLSQTGCNSNTVYPTLNNPSLSTPAQGSIGNHTLGSNEPNMLNNAIITHVSNLSVSQCPSPLPPPDVPPISSLEFTPQMIEVVESVMREVVRGNPASVVEYLSNPANAVDCTVTGGKTLLHILAYQGCVEELKLILARGACVYYPDDAGDTAMHYAAFGNRPEAIKILIGAGGGINFFNKLRHTPLHVAVFQNFPLCVQTLLQHGCDVNIQDNNLDTPLHDAIAKELEDIILLLLAHPGVNLYLENSKGFNILNYAVLRGNAEITGKILEQDRNLATKPKTSDGFSPLHVASYNDHIDIVKILGEKYDVDINVVDLKNRTPIMVAVGQASTNAINYLMQKDVKWNVQDTDGNSVLHSLLLRRNQFKRSLSRESAPALYEQYLSVGGPSNEHGVLVAVFLALVGKGAPLSLENKEKQKALDLILDETSLLNEILEHGQMYLTSISDVNENDNIVHAISQLKLDEKLQARKLSVPCLPVECSVCSELGVANVLLKPCNHAVACEECSSRMKKCIVCRTLVEVRVTNDGRLIPGIERCDKSKTERVNYLESKISEIEELNTCTICMERSRNTIFLCGHGTCDVCAKTLKFCHMCRKLIEQRINVFL